MNYVNKNSYDYPYRMILSDVTEDNEYTQQLVYEF